MSPHPGSGNTAASAAPSSALVWPESYSTPRLQRFGTLTELTLSGTQDGIVENNIFTQKYRPKLKS